MRFLCILIPFAMVNVMVAVIDEYTRQVIITNKLIERADAEDRMPDIIRNTVVNGKYTMEKISLMLAVPEFEDSSGNLNLGNQLLMRGEIKAIVAIIVPAINEAEYQDVTLEELGSARRRITTEAIKTVLSAVIRNEKDPYFTKFGLRNLCKLLGLFRSVQHPSSPVVMASFRYDICTLGTNNTADIRYRYINDQIWEIKSNNLLTQPLADQIQ
ncbi:uncharacterized protein LOC126837506 [Adelges cooleyi]|uniref:uncharacterized protein LOC126837506 n=1 Tax=Adelges cooleyi TaxID=133065 RepID=UPI00217F2F12|nr:uncharacterized protein LOC126837506 [Adelges cooleyi]XP_050427381.1 uncharacterized protein LOC126837506 [Adelges cooleyi]XP_050427382.1 uncharacterized protein LOC126837506 [Adelges cooleyi]